MGGLLSRMGGLLSRMGGLLSRMGGVLSVPPAIAGGLNEENKQKWLVKKKTETM